MMTESHVISLTRRLKVLDPLRRYLPLCMNNCLHQNTTMYGLSKTSVETHNRVANPTCGQAHHQIGTQHDIVNNLAIIQVSARLTACSRPPRTKA
jgi:hypothetical protein